MNGFTHLHCHTTWSLLDGAIPAEALPHLAAEAGFDAVAITDHDALTGAVRFVTACRDAGVKPILGAELTVAPRSEGTGCGRPAFPRYANRFSASLGNGVALAGREKSGKPQSGRSSQATDHITVIARDAVGYGNLCRLITDAHLSNERGRPCTTFEAIAARSEGLYVLSGCERGEVARLAAAGLVHEAIDAARRWRAAVGDGYRLEVFDHRGYGHRALRDKLLRIATETGISAVATNDVHYAFSADAITHELLHAINEIVPLAKSQALRSNSEYGLKGAAGMHALFDDAPEALDETVRIAESCELDLGLGEYHFPEIPIPKGETATGLLARRCYQGAARRYGRVPCAVEDRLQHELNMIFRMGFAAYFLLVADIVDHVRRVLGVRCACRGSAAGSLVCYVLGISDVDPVRYDLLFERFMNSRRDEMPDIDVDVESHRREEVLDYILATYGADQTAVCCMVDTFRARMAIREVGKALGLPPEEIDVVAKAFPRVAARDIPGAIDRLPELQGSNLRAGQLEQLFELCLAIDGFPRHLALHPSGVILSSPDLADRVPMQESFQGFTMLQADKDDVEELGLVKLDVLGVRMLSSITHACDEIARARGDEVDLGAIPHDDEKTFELIRSSRTLGCFQIESPGQRELLARLQPDSFEDLIVDISLFRPGPVKSDMITPYLQRRHGFEDVRYPHPTLQQVLAETHGIIVFHEQVIRVIAAATGCSLDDADFVRRHLDAEPPSLSDDPDNRPARRGADGLRGGESENAIGRWFQAAAVRTGHSPEQAAALWREVFAFASFGFCKSHAAAFALPTYLSSWLKAHYPAEFLAGVLTHDPGMYPRRLIVADARQLGIPILPIDVNASDKLYRVEAINEIVQIDEGGCRRPRSSRCANHFPASLGEGVALAGSGGPYEGSEDGRFPKATQNGWEPEGGRSPAAASKYGIRLALSEVRDISTAEIDSIIDARGIGPFRSLEDLWRRTELSRPVFENLVHVGAVDSIAGGRSRRELLWKIAALAAEPRVHPGEQLSFDLDEPVEQSLPGLPAYTPLEETEAELEISGIDARRHVLALYAPLLAEIGCIPAAQLARQRNDSDVWVGGVKVASQTPAIRSGQRIIFVTLDDLTGPIDITVFERVQPRCARTVFHSWMLLVRGVVRKRGGASFIHPTHPHNVGITVVVDEVFDLAELAADRNAGHSVPAALGRQRRKQVVVQSNGDSQPQRSRVDTTDRRVRELEAPTKLWHSSGGSAGR